MNKPMTDALRRAYALVERDLRKRDVSEIRLWKQQFWLADGKGEPATTTIEVRGQSTRVYAMSLREAVEKAKATP